MQDRTPTPEKKQNYSQKRQAILESIQSTNSHPTAEWIYQQLKPSFPSLSIGTVYRNISQLKESGMIIGVGIVEGHERFDGNTAPHGHFVCNHCGRVIDIENDHVSPATIKLVTEELDVQIRNHELTFYGRCSHCK